MKDTDSLFTALNDKTRRQILHLLKKGDMAPTEIGLHFSISKPSLSHHLDILKRARLVTTQREGQRIIYSLNQSVFEEIATELYDIFGTFFKRKINEGGL